MKIKRKLFILVLLMGVAVASVYFVFMQKSAETSPEKEVKIESADKELVEIERNSQSVKAMAVATVAPDSDADADSDSDSDTNPTGEILTNNKMDLYHVVLSLELEMRDAYREGMVSFVAEQTEASHARLKEQWTQYVNKSNQDFVSVDQVLNGEHKEDDMYYFNMTTYLEELKELQGLLGEAIVQQYDEKQISVVEAVIQSSKTNIEQQIYKK